MTVAPSAASSSAIAAPMPRLAPVTSAISPLSASSWLMRSKIPRLRPRARRRSRPACRARVRPGTCRCAWPGRPAPCPDRIRRSRVAPRCGQRLHAARPAHRQVELAHQRIADRVHAVVRASRPRSAPPGDRHSHCRPAMVSASCVGRVAHQRRVRRHAHRELDRLAHATFGQHRQRAHRPQRRGRRSRSALASCSWPGPRLGCRRRLRTPRPPARHRRPGPPPSHRCRPEPRPASAAALAHQVGAVGSDSAPAATSAVYSPRLWPASASGADHRCNLPCTPHRHPRGKQCRLGVFGAVEQFFRAALRQRPQVDAGTGRGFVEGRLRRTSMQFREFGQHADRLRAWPKTLCGLRSRGKRWNQGMRMIRAIALARLYPGVLGLLAAVARAASAPSRCVRTSCSTHRQALRDRPASAMRAFAHPALACVLQCGVLTHGLLAVAQAARTPACRLCSVAQQRRAPGEAAAEGFQQDNNGRAGSCPSAPPRRAPAAPNRTRYCRAGPR
jgi:hypothetical protein